MLDWWFTCLLFKYNSVSCSPFHTTPHHTAPTHKPHHGVCVVGHQHSGAIVLFFSMYVDVEDEGKRKEVSVDEAEFAYSFIEIDRYMVFFHSISVFATKKGFCCCCSKVWRLLERACIRERKVIRFSQEWWRSAANCQPNVPSSPVAFIATSEPGQVGPP